MTPALLALVARAEETHRYALLVGTNDGGPERPSLRYAHDDADAMADVLGRLGGVSADRSRVLYDPSLGEVRDAFAALSAEIGADPARTEVVFYYSGHSDEEGLLLGGERLPWKEVRGAIEGLGADVRLAILDSCASGSLILAKGGTHVSPFVIDAALQVEGSAYLTSSSADEVSQEGERVGGSYFTHSLTTGLLGAADATGDGRVTLTEAYAFARDETLLQTERTQHGPQHANYDLRLEGSGELVLTDLTRRSASLVLAGDLAGRATLRSSDGTLVAELDKPAGPPVSLALPAGDYVLTVVPSGGDTYGEAELTLDEGTSSLLSLGDLAISSREATLARKGGDAAKRRLPARFPIDPTEVPATGIDTFVIGALGGRSSTLDGYAWGTFAYAVDGSAAGVVGSLVTTRVGTLSGGQVSFGANRAGDGEGVQLAVGGNGVARGFDGLQLSAGANAAGHGTRGAQLTAGVNLAPGGLRGLQLSLGLNGAGDRVVGLQLSSVNLAADVGGAQLGVVNGGRDVDGLQLGVVNVARDVTGVQFGLINVAHDVKGTPIGLLSFVKDGRHSVLVSVSESDLANVDFKLGDTFHTSLGGGIRPDRHFHGAVGAGVHGVHGKAWADVDCNGVAWFPIGPALGPPGNKVTEATPTVAVQGRVTAGFQVTKAFAPFVGAGVHYRVVDGDATASPWGRDPVVWPSLFAGIQLF